MLRKNILAICCGLLISGFFPAAVHARVDFFCTGAQMGLGVMSDSLFLGASFIYQDGSKDVIVSFFNSDAGWEGRLYFMVPGITDSAYYLFTNKPSNHPNEPTRVNLSNIFDIPVGSRIYFRYDVPNHPPKYTGENLPGIDEYASTSTHIYQGQEDRRWSTAGRIKDANGEPTDSAEFTFEDDPNGDFDLNDIIFRVNGLGLNIEVQIPYIDSAVVYDAVGNGIGDSLVISFNGIIDLSTLFMVNLIWPENTPWQQLDLSNLHLETSYIISLPFTPTSQQVITDGTGEVVVTFDTLGTQVEREADALDGVGPLLKDKAYVIERHSSGNDTFFVSFTEKMNVSAIAGKSFILIKKETQKEIELTLLDPAVDIGSEDSITFAIADLGIDAPEQDDSLKILYTGPVVDKPRGNHAHPDNTPVPIVLINTPILVDSATYHDDKDNRADGVVDKVRIFFKHIIADLQSLEIKVTWIEGNLTGKAENLVYDASDSTIVVADIENIFGKVLQDRTSGKMKLSVEFTSGSNTTITCDVSDRAGPVISKAVYCPTGYGDNIGFDTLVVLFSEEIRDINSTEPFEFITLDGTFYNMTLKLMEHDIDQAVFEVVEIFIVEEPEKGDSIWIDYQENISDTCNNEQDIKDNKRVELIVKGRPFIFIITVIGPVDPLENEIPDIFIDLEDPNHITNGTVIILDPVVEIPDSIIELVHCAVSIYDPVGNLVAECESREDKNKQLQIDITKINGKNVIYILWTGKNRKNRNVGSGSYLGRVLIKYPDGKETINDVLISVKR